MRTLFTAGTICLFSLLLFGQQPSPQKSNIPIELQALNPDVRAKLTEAHSDSKAGKYPEAFEEDQEALDAAKKAGYSPDIALAEDAMASDDFVMGKLEASWDLDREALQKAVASSNFVLQADVLTSLSTYSQTTGNLKGALAILSQALDAAEKSKDLYIKSRVLGEMGRLQLLLGEKEEAKKSLDEALRIDSLNSYSLYALHLVYQAYLLLLNDQTIKEGIQELEKARDIAASRRNYLALVQAENALGISYIHIGDVQQGLRILQSLRSGEIGVSEGTQETQAEFRGVLALPFIRVTLLEALGNASEAAKRPSDAIAVWSDLYSFSNGMQFITPEAEAAQHLANLYASQGDNENAAKYARAAAEGWRTGGNEVRAIQSLGAEAVGLALLYFLSRLAEQYGCEYIWGEATQLSCDYYRKVLSLNSVTDLILIPRDKFVEFATQLNLLWQGKSRAITSENLTVQEVYQLEEERSPMVGNRSAVCLVNVLWTKFDYFEAASDPEHARFLAQLESEIRSEFGSRIGRLSFSRIAARPTQVDSLKFGHGLPELLTYWASASPRERPMKLLPTILALGSRESELYASRHFSGSHG